MTIKQISVFLENKSGRLAEVLGILGEQKIKIHALTIADTSEYGILRLIVNDYQKAVEVLKSKEFTANLTDVIAVLVPNQAGEFAALLQNLAKETISVEYMYAFGMGDKSVIILRPESIDLTHHVLRKHNNNLISVEDLSKL
jgi:hypothetical protein